MTASLLTLGVPLGLGIAAGAARLFPEPDAAIGALNTYVLYLAFPILILVGITDRAFTLPSGLAFYAVVPAVGLILAAGLALLRHVPALRPILGVTAMTSLFANTAYVGLPVIEAVLGPEHLGLGALAVAIHVTTAMVVGPALLLLWSGQSDGALGASMSKVVRQPLAWAPVIGLLLRLVPVGFVEPASALLAPVGRTASPVGLFLIGLFLHTHARSLSVRPALGVHLASKLLVVPALTWALVLVGRALGQLDQVEGQVLLLLSAMPTAISTFALAREFDTAVGEVTITIMVSTALAVVWIPLAASLV